MSASQIAALVFTVALLVTNVYFLLGSVPLLVLKHDTPMDSRFVRGFFVTYYRAALFAASAAAVSYAFAGMPVFAAAAAALAVLAAVLRRIVIAKMDSLREQMQISGASAVAAFRRIHVAAISVNLLQIVFIVSSLIVVSMQMKR